ncbi:MAG: homocysteine S-methyltransferase family protein [Hyphomicrobiales bacterium]
MSYENMKSKLAEGGVVILDGGTGTELERRGVDMNPEAWCGVATLEAEETLVEVHKDYIRAGAEVITANTFASSRLMLSPAGFADSVDEVNRKAVRAAHKACAELGAENVLIAGSLSHMVPIAPETAKPDPARIPDNTALADAFGELAQIHKQEGCDLILMEMMYDPGRMELALAAAGATGLPVWAGLSARRADDGAVLSFAAHEDIAYGEIVALASRHKPDAIGTMHTPSNLISDCDAIIAQEFDGARMAYPDSGYFKMPSWQFEDIIPPEEFAAYADEWKTAGVQIIGGCCGLSPKHIQALAPLKSAS